MLSIDVHVREREGHRGTKDFRREILISSPTTASTNDKKNILSRSESNRPSPTIHIDELPSIFFY